jgi:DNA-binding LytR/AlgR family response regulator
MESSEHSALELRARSIAVLDGELVSIRHGATTTLVSRRDLLSAESARNNTVIQTRAGEVRVRQPLGAVVEDLGAVGFVQIHRRIAVNLAAVRQLIGRGGHRLSLRLDDGRWLEVGRSFQREIRSRVRGP